MVPVFLVLLIASFAVGVWALVATPVWLRRVLRPMVLAWIIAILAAIAARLW